MDQERKQRQRKKLKDMRSEFQALLACANTTFQAISQTAPIPENNIHYNDKTQHEYLSALRKLVDTYHTQVARATKRLKRIQRLNKRWDNILEDNDDE